MVIAVFLFFGKLRLNLHLTVISDSGLLLR